MTTKADAQVEDVEEPQTATGPVERAREVVTDVADAALSAVQAHTPALSDVADAARSAVQTHGPAVIGVSRSTAESAYQQVRQAPDDQLALGTAFAGGLVTGFVLARVPRLLIMLALVPLAVFGGTLLGRHRPFRGGGSRAKG